MRAPPGKNTRTFARVQALGAFSLLTALVVITAYQITPLVEFIPRSLDYFTRAREYHLARRWQAYDYFDRTQAIVARTPPDALIVLPAQSNLYGPLGNAGLTDYMVFPRHATNSNDPRIQTYQGPVYRVVGEPDSGEISVVPVRERRAAAAPIERDFILVPRTAAPLALALVKFLLVVLGGAFPVRTWFRLRTVPGALAASALLGMTLQAAIFIVLAFSNIPAGESLQYVILLALALPGVVSLIRRRPHITIPRTRAEWVAEAAAMGALALIFFLGISKPIVEWDAMAIWGIKARLIFATETLRTLGLWGAYPEYPPLVPVAMSQLGIGGELAVKALFPLFAWCLYGVVYEGLELRGWVRWLAPLPLLFAPQIGEQSGNGYANLALAVYVTLAVILFARWVKQRDRALAVATALTLTGLVLVRPDGEVYLLYLLLLLLFLVWRQHVNKRDALFFAIPLGIDALWKIFFTLHLRSASGSAFGIASVGQQFIRYLLTTRPPRAEILPVTQTLLEYSLGPGFWGLLPFAFMGMLALCPRVVYTRYPLELAFLILSGAGLALLALYLAPRWGIDYFFNATYLRLYMAVVPLMYILTWNVFAGEWNLLKQSKAFRVVPA